MTDAPDADRRTMLAASAAVLSTAAVAGCVKEEGSGADGNSTEAEALSFEPPALPRLPENEYWSFVIRSIDYQSQQLMLLLGSDPQRPDLTRPVPPQPPDDEHWSYLVESHDMQNRALESLAADGGGGDDS